MPSRAGGRARAEPPTPAAGWPSRALKDSWVGKQGRRPAGQPQPDLALRTGNCKVSLGGDRGGEAFSLFRFRACLNSLAQKTSPLGACLFLPATLRLSQPQGLFCSHCFRHPTPQPKNKDKHPLPIALPACRLPHPGDSGWWPGGRGPDQPGSAELPTSAADFLLWSSSPLCLFDLN